MERKYNLRIIHKFLIYFIRDYSKDINTESEDFKTTLLADSFTETKDRDQITFFRCLTLRQTTYGIR